MIFFCKYDVTNINSLFLYKLLTQKRFIMEIFIALITLVAAILQIILFFKVWGMTNNVDSIKSKYVDTKQQRKSVPKRRIIANHYFAIQAIDGKEAADKYVNSLIIDYISFVLSEETDDLEQLTKKLLVKFGPYFIEDKLELIKKLYNERFVEELNGIKVNKKVLVRVNNYGTAPCVCAKIDRFGMQIKSESQSVFPLENVQKDKNSE